VFAETEVLYAGKTVNLLAKIGDVVKDLSNAGLQLAILLPSRISGGELLIPDMSKRCIIHVCTFYNFEVITLHLQYDHGRVLEVGRQSRTGIRAAPVSPALVYTV
jgi:hypothetical protein